MSEKKSDDNEYLQWDNEQENLPRVLDPVTTMGVVRKYVENERARTRRTVVWLGFTFVFIALIMLVLFLGVGLYVMSNSEKAARIAEKSSERAAEYGAEVQDLSSEVTGISSGQRAIQQMLEKRQQTEAREDRMLKSDLKRFSEWIAETRKDEDARFASVNRKLSELETLVSSKEAQIAELKQEYRQLSNSVATVGSATGAGATVSGPGGPGKSGVAAEGGDSVSVAQAGDLPETGGAGAGVATVSVSDEASLDKYLSEDEGQLDIEEPVSPPKDPREIRAVTFPNGDRYEGEFRNGLFHGWGVYYYQDGDRYEGQFRKDMKHGRGTMYYSNGDRYTGQFRNDMREGHGSMVFADGDKYVGMFRNGMINGNGTMVYENGGKYSGAFENGLKDGNGTFHYPNGDVYEGQFRDDMRDGKGRYLFSNGAKYIGEFDEGKKHGEGRYVYPSGAEYRGEFRDGKRSGEGVCIYPDGKKLKGVWKGGELVRTFS